MPARGQAISSHLVGHEKEDVGWFGLRNDRGQSRGEDQDLEKGGLHCEL